MLDQFLLADGSAAVEQQIFQNAALLARERKRLSVRRGRAAAGIKRQPAAPQAYILLDKSAARQTAHTRFQFL